MSKKIKLVDLKKGDIEGKELGDTHSTALVVEIIKVFKVPINTSIIKYLEEFKKNNSTVFEWYCELQEIIRETGPLVNAEGHANARGTLEKLMDVQRQYDMHKETAKMTHGNNEDRIASLRRELDKANEENGLLRAHSTVTCKLLVLERTKVRELIECRDTNANSTE